MIPLSLEGKVALVTGVGDNMSFAWHISKALQAAGARLARACAPLMENRPGGAAIVGLSYLGGDRVVPHYGGGMSTAKAALQIDAKQLAHNLGPKNIRVNIISAGPYASRAASAIGDIDQMIAHAASASPLPRGISAEEVANTTAFLCSPLASAITAQVLYVDCGYNA